MNPPASGEPRSARMREKAKQTLDQVRAATRAPAAGAPPRRQRSAPREQRGAAR